MSSSDHPRPETLCARPPDQAETTTRPLVPPLNLSVVYKIDGLDAVDDVYEGRSPGKIYARDGHPNADQLAAKVAALEGAESAMVCASGMGAEAAAILASVDSGDNIALSEGLYGKTTALVARELSRFGITHTLFDATKAETLGNALAPRTRVVFVETLSNPLVRLADIEGLSTIARKAGARLFVDHTFAPLLCHPLAMGADLVIHSGTKLIGGHSDLTLGLVAGARDLVARSASVASTFGMTGNPFESWLALRGLATLPLRSSRSCSTALELAERLSGHRKVKAVHYPGLRDHPDHARAVRVLSGGFGTICTIDLGDRASADGFIKALASSIPFAPSLGDVATTLSHPATTSHRGQSADQWMRGGINPGLIRLSIGLEDPGDLWKELESALGTY